MVELTVGPRAHISTYNASDKAYCASGPCNIGSMFSDREQERTDRTEFLCICTT